MKAKMNKDYLLTYEVEVEAEDIGEAVKLGDLEQVKMKARLQKIESDDESWERFYEDE